MSVSGRVPFVLCHEGDALDKCGEVLSLNQVQLSLQTIFEKMCCTSKCFRSWLSGVSPTVVRAAGISAILGCAGSLAASSAGVAKSFRRLSPSPVILIPSEACCPLKSIIPVGIMLRVASMGVSACASSGSNSAPYMRKRCCAFRSPSPCLASLSSTAGSCMVANLRRMPCITLSRERKVPRRRCAPPRVAPNVFRSSVGGHLVCLLLRC